LIYKNKSARPRCKELHKRIRDFLVAVEVPENPAWEQVALRLKRGETADQARHQKGACAIGREGHGVAAAC
jgi:hypothetical protein